VTDAWRPRAPWQQLAARASKFGAVGALCFVVDTAVFNLLRLVAHGKPLTVSVVATTISMVVNYLGNRHFSFSDGVRHSRRRELALFVVVNGAALVVGQIPLAISRYVLELDSVLADNVSRVMIGTALGMIVRFWGYHRFVFPHELALVDRDATAPVSPAVGETARLNGASPDGAGANGAGTDGSTPATSADEDSTASAWSARELSAARDLAR
jgi:putative flippase GtrA